MNHTVIAHQAQVSALDSQHTLFSEVEVPGTLQDLLSVESQGEPSELMNLLSLIRVMKSIASYQSSPWLSWLERTTVTLVAS
ncbi:13111_t:CDS:2, partial [Acaulospora colombiana]